MGNLKFKLTNMSDQQTNKLWRIKKWNAVAMWAWDIDADACTICRQQMNDPCIECQANQGATTTEDCMIAWGICNHAFHAHCIQRWLKARQVCPLDNGNWEYSKFGKQN